MAMPPITLSAMPLIVHVIVVVSVVSSDNAPFDLSRSLPLNKWLPIVQDLPPPCDQNLPTHYVAFGLSGTQALPQTHARAYSPLFSRTQDDPHDSPSCTPETPSPLPSSPCTGHAPGMCPPRSPSGPS